MSLIDPWLLARLACPYDGAAVRLASASVVCTVCGCNFAVVEGIPVMLREDVRQTHDAARASLAQVRPTAAVAANGAAATNARQQQPSSPTAKPVAEGPSTQIDPFVQQAVGATGGYMYAPLMERLRSYPVPNIRVPAGPGEGRTWLDIGCNWGRWCFAAARIGYVPVGIDPMLGGVRAAARVARQLGLTAHFIVGDARYVPLQPETVDVAFSYSVLQHMAKHDVRRALREMRRVLRPSGIVAVQLPNAWGLRSLSVQAERRWRPAENFEVRYWTVPELRATFEHLVGPTNVTVDGYFSLNVQTADLPLLPLRFRAIVRTSEWLRHMAERFPSLVRVADSLYVSAHRHAPGDAAETPAATRSERAQ
jgi:ubiquinone/menaquinone biosynthesis C-methylase UbiE/uncharacterized protein YbaR (Trm112 family)